MRFVHASVVSSFVLAAAIVEGCVDNSNNGPPPNPDASVPGSDASASDSSTPNDGGTTSDTGTDGSAQSDASTDGGALTPITCGAVTTIDAAHKAQVPLNLVSLQGGKTLAVWAEASGTLNVANLKARLHDGTAWQAEHPFTAKTLPFPVYVGADGAGNALLFWLQSGGGSVNASVMTNAGTWGAETNFAFGGGLDMSVAGFRGSSGGGLALLLDGTAASISSNASGTTSWTALDPLQGGNFSRPSVATNAAGKGAALWYKSNADGHRADLSLVTYNGSTWSAVIPLTIGAGGAGSSAQPFGVGVLANGDPVVGWFDGTNTVNRVYVQRYQLGTSTWAAADKAYESATITIGSPSQIYVDAADRITVVFTAQSGNLYFQHNPGTGWPATPTELQTPAGNVGKSLAFDPVTGNFAAAVNSGNVIGLTRLAAAGTTWDTPVTSVLPYGPGNVFSTAFDGNHAAIAQWSGVAPNVQIDLVFCK